MILVIDCGSDKTHLIAQIVDEFIDVEQKPLLDLHEVDLSKYQGIIISGAPLLVTEIDTQPYIDKIKWVGTVEIPVLGICFGHQLIGLYYEAQASKMREDRDWQVVEHFIDSPIFNRLPNEIEMMEDHCETISIPPGFELVASSDACVNEAMQHKERPIYGVQFHPEVSGNHGRVIVENFVKICLS